LCLDSPTETRNHRGRAIRWWEMNRYLTWRPWVGQARSSRLRRHVASQPDCIPGAILVEKLECRVDTQKLSRVQLNDCERHRVEMDERSTLTTVLYIDRSGPGTNVVECL